jgi:LmbE family N-acetylglucosaminyl deacetylase
MHVFLSPHLDDAVLSCGALIHQLTQSGHAVLVITILAGDPPPTLPQTALMRHLHQKWDVGSSPYETRREEDIAALQSLDAQWEHLSLLDAPYRTSKKGVALYTEQASLFDKLHPDDPVLKAGIDIPESAAMVYAPMGAGGHVDHLAVNRLARRLPDALRVVYYEDYPYSSEGDEIRHARRDRVDQRYGSAAVQTALKSYAVRLQPSLIELSEENLLAKFNAIRCYLSQLGTFWNNEAEMEDGERRYARQIAAKGAERLWIQGEIDEPGIS